MVIISAVSLCNWLQYKQIEAIPSKKRRSTPKIQASLLRKRGAKVRAISNITPNSPDSAFVVS